MQTSTTINHKKPSFLTKPLLTELSTEIETLPSKKNLTKTPFPIISTNITPKPNFKTIKILPKNKTTTKLNLSNHWWNFKTFGKWTFFTRKSNWALNFFSKFKLRDWSTWKTSKRLHLERMTRRKWYRRWTLVFRVALTI